ncbi:MAG: hypothetical protein QM775_03915 [Pirellulales bacterium]
MSARIGQKDPHLGDGRHAPAQIKGHTAEKSRIVNHFGQRYLLLIAPLRQQSIDSLRTLFGRQERRGIRGRRHGRQ